MKIHWISITLGSILAMPLLASSQTSAKAPATPAASAPIVVPALVPFAGSAIDDRGKALGEEASITFQIFKDDRGGSALWMETQTVVLDATGHYKVQLGASSPNGIPVDLFQNGEARWLEVQMAGQAPQARVLLASVPYALKAADSETLAGHAVSDFVTQKELAIQAAARDAAAQNNATAAAPAGLTGSGTAKFVPVWTSASALGDSALYQAASGTKPRMGINTTSPVTTLDINGTSTVRGTLNLPSAVATATAGTNSPLLELSASSFSSTAKAAQAQKFGWEAVAGANNTTTPTANLNLFYGAGTATPKSTGLAISPQGLITFAPGQTFPGASSGAITGVTATSPLTGGGTTGNVTVGLNTPSLETSLNGVYAQLGAPDTFAAPITFAAGQTFPGAGTITAVQAGTALTGGGTTGAVTLNLDTTKVPLLAAANAFTGNQTIAGTLTSSVSASSALGPILALTNPAGGLDAAASVDFRTYLHTATAATPSARIEAVDDNDYGNNLLFQSKTPGSDANGLQNNLVIYDSGRVGIPNNTGLGQFEVVAPTLSGFDGMVAIAGVGGPIMGKIGVPDYIGGDGGFFAGGEGLLNGTAITSTGGTGVYGIGGGGESTAIGGDGGVFYGGTAVSNGGDGLDATAGPFYGESAYMPFAGNFTGNVNVSGTLTASTKMFKIDHPLDPANKYLYHASIESSEMVNIYSGNVTTDDLGIATVQLPEWFEALNGDFRYQLTVVGQFAQAIVSKKIENHQFTISTNATHVEVSWQVTGVRRDAFAVAHPLVAEQEKPQRERGYYIHPELYGQPAEKQTEWGRRPQAMRVARARLDALKAKALQSIPAPSPVKSTQVK